MAFGRYSTHEKWPQLAWRSGERIFIRMTFYKTAFILFNLREWYLSVIDYSRQEDTQQIFCIFGLRVGNVGLLKTVILSQFIQVNVFRMNVVALQIQTNQGSLTEGGRLSTLDLLVLTSLEQLIFILKILFTVFLQNKLL